MPLTELRMIFSSDIEEESSFVHLPLLKSLLSLRFSFPNGYGAAVLARLNDDASAFLYYEVNLLYNNKLYKGPPVILTDNAFLISSEEDLLYLLEEIEGLAKPEEPPRAFDPVP